ncbi:Hypothetical_protein [Hexamita inflata]|uniref:Hypothetical_protein n=1 Tax=Hexamita inflata TaxID=28002 RepID=A0AA86UKB8_9EUKA|nr:Hypothetical protein HINF_LOCUS46739 [Hexamita inflata]
MSQRILSSQQIACYITSSVVQILTLAIQFVYVKKNYMSKQFKQIQSPFIVIFYVSFLLGVVINPVNSWVNVLIDRDGISDYLFLHIAFKNMLRSTIPAFMIILNVIMSYSLFQKSNRLKIDVTVASTLMLFYCSIQILAESVCSFSSSQLCPHPNGSSWFASPVYQLTTATFRIAPLLVQAVLAFFLPRCLKVEYYEYEEEETLLKEKQNELYIIQQKRIVLLQVLISTLSFFLDVTFTNCVQPFFEVEFGFMCWIECFMECLSVFTGGFVYCLKIQVQNIVINGQ